MMQQLLTANIHQVHMVSQTPVVSALHKSHTAKVGKVTFYKQGSGTQSDSGIC